MSLNKTFLIALLFLPMLQYGQTQDSIVLNFEEYLQMVKTFHPVVRQARLKADLGDAELLKARGGFDPKIEANYDRKDFKDTRYFDLFNAAFKIPTWYGVELKAKFEQNEGFYLNPQNNVPDDGLFAAGISVPIGQGLFINERMAALKQAKAYQQQSLADQQLAVNKVLYDASVAYFDWISAYRELKLYNNFIENAQFRYDGILSSFEVGDKPAIDTLEADIQIQDRKLSLEQARLKFFKASQQLGTYLWAENNTPLVTRERVYPEDALFENSTIPAEFLSDTEIPTHPKIRSLEYKVEILEFDRRLKANKLLPKLDLEYNFLSGDPDILRSFVNENYKVGVNFSIPLFLRKERGDLQKSKIKLQDAELELYSEQLNLQNKIRALKEQFLSYQEQVLMINQLVENYEIMLNAEERKLQLGESSVFLVNTREKSLISARLKQISVQEKLWNTRAELTQVLAILD
ncbi:TolC family protein [Christiangramia sp. OXR-203]|jgi:outer membrane protein TolC|uniref:TolC family protein n=1 Tax=Christiangramia sp. OXR-203 TaxID=3100176 RepID=UPI002AC9C092|nr:TolC family protein [Christiangramia sp. OXR-203]WPY99791.1 TolC family protein [Christiangramia sp. OXR-203]